LDVEIDGAIAGKTPWEGRVAPGDHEVRLHGLVGLDVLAGYDAPEAGSAGAQATGHDRVEMGSKRATVAVRLYEATSLTLAGEDLDGSLRVEASPGEGAISIDGKRVAQGAWEGRLPLGAHSVEVAAEGFLPAKKEVSLVRRKQLELHVDLVRD